ncbi:MAG: hypothetical protein IJ484_08585 [Oscillospiraceae bacterium]|nr:hypothetical protein [Oscillospiraceae bacterium]
MREMNCLRCGAAMNFLKSESIQLGEYGFFVGDWAHLRAGGLAVDIYICPECGKLEFFRAEGEDEEERVGWTISKTTCPHCGKKYDMDYPKCPFCKRAPKGPGLR